MVDPAGTLTFLNEARVVVVINDIPDLHAGEVLVKVPVIAHAAPPAGPCSVILTSPSLLTRIPLRRCDCDRYTLGVAVVEVPPVSVSTGLSAAGAAAGVGAAVGGASAGGAATATDTVVVAVPERSVMVTVEVAVATSVGVPLITPVAVSRLSPAGRAGLTLKVAVPVRRTVGVMLVMDVPTVAVIAPGYDTDAVPKP